MMSPLLLNCTFRLNQATMGIPEALGQKIPNYVTSCAWAVLRGRDQVY